MSFHQYRIDELYSNASGTVQFIELSVDYYDGESYWSGVPLTTTPERHHPHFQIPQQPAKRGYRQHNRIDCDPRLWQLTKPKASQSAAISPSPSVNPSSMEPATSF